MSQLNKSINIGDPFWLDNIAILFQTNRLNEFIPNNEMAYKEKLNAIVRFSIYLSIILFLLKDNYLVFYIPIFISVFTYYLKNNKVETDTESFNNNLKEKNIKHEANTTNKYSRCQRPSYNNPFMNILQTDYKYRPERPPACRLNQQINKEIEDKFDVNLYKDISDIYGKKNSQRQYYTTPSTTIPNDQESFSRWLYGTPPTCKQGNPEQCIANIYDNILADTPFKYKYIN